VLLSLFHEKKMVVTDLLLLLQ